jgi:hypothetical protein
MADGAGGYQFGMDMSSALASVANFNNDASITFGDRSGGQTADNTSKTSPTSTAARSLQGGVSPEVDKDVAGYDPSGLTSGVSLASFSPTGQVSYILYALLAIVALTIIVLLKKRA